MRFRKRLERIAQQVIYAAQDALNWLRGAEDDYGTIFKVEGRMGDDEDHLERLKALESLQASLPLDKKPARLFVDYTIPARTPVEELVGIHLEFEQLQPTVSLLELFEPFLSFGDPGGKRVGEVTAIFRYGD